MYTIYRFKLVVLYLVFSLLVLACTKDEEKIDLTKNYLFTGQVFDQVTREPVSGAIVRYGHKLFGEQDHALNRMPQYGITGADGKYKLVVPKEVFDDYQRYPGPVIYAEGANYIGSDILHAPKGGENMDLELYYSSILQLHVWNDTINNQIDEIKIWITGNSSFWVYPGFVGIVVQGWYPWPQFTFKGREFDTVLVINDLWGNLTYSVCGGKGYFPGPYYFSYPVKLIPGTINYLEVSF